LYKRRSFSVQNAVIVTEYTSMQSEVIEWLQVQNTANISLLFCKSNWMAIYLVGPYDESNTTPDIS
jgi:hypothetical protein